MVTEDHEMNIRLEMFFVQFDNLLRQHVSPSAFFLALLSHFATVVFPIPQDYWTKYKTKQTHQDTSAVREPRLEQNKTGGATTKMPFLQLILTVLGKASTWTSMEGGLGQYCTVFCFCFLPVFQRPNFYHSINVGATPDRHKTAFL